MPRQKKANLCQVCSKNSQRIKICLKRKNDVCGEEGVSGWRENGIPLTFDVHQCTKL